jgi:hypothetical protein
MTKQLEPTAKIIVLKKDVPFREGTAVHKRGQAVLRSKTVAEALKRGARPSTVRYFVECKQVRLVAAEARAAAKKSAGKAVAA